MIKYTENKKGFLLFDKEKNKITCVRVLEADSMGKERM